MFKRILIANRGEIACRIIKACETLGIESVAVYSEADTHLTYLSRATHAVSIGPAPASQSYLNQTRLLQVAEEYECEAVHPGYGFLSENALFATRCEQQKLTFIGPRPNQIRLMGDKATAISTLKSAGLVTLPGSSQIVSSHEEARDIAETLGYPVLFKATAGGGGKGMRLVRTHQELASSFAEASLEAQKAFSNSALYLEKYIEHARHIEFQILSDAYGQVAILGERDCSIQQRHQKLVEECPAPNFPAELRKTMSLKIREALIQIGYLGAGTLEFLMDASQNLYFMEMNTRIQVEHPITELVYGVDLVAWQIRIAAGQKLGITSVKPQGHAIECRINALSPGVVSQLKVPDGARWDSYLESGTEVTPYYDSMLAKLIVHAPTRAQAVKSMQRALMDLSLEGVQTSQALQQQIISMLEFQEGNYSCSLLSTPMSSRA